MKAVRVLEPKDIRFDDEAPSPGAPGPGEVLGAPLLAGICGTDVKEFLGYGMVVPGQPQILGHEFAIRVVEVGEGVENVQPGDRAAVMPFQHCGRCTHCWNGSFILCPYKTCLGLNEAGGGFGDLVLAKDYQLTSLGDLTDEQGALVEPAAVSLNAVLVAEVTAGDSVLVLGAGPVGSLAVLSAFAAGATRVYVSEPNAKRAAIIKQLGATQILSGDYPDQTDRALELTGGYGVDKVIDCAGKDGTLNFAVSAVRNGGTVCVPSVHRGSTDFDVRSITRRAISVKGALGYTREAWIRTVRMIADGTYGADQIVTSQITREDILADGFEALTDPDRGQLKIMVRVND